MRRSWWYVAVASLASAGLACGDDDTSKEPVDLLYISDSSGWGVAEEYARLAEEELGRPVNIIDWRGGGQSLATVMTMIEDNPEKVAQAEIVVLQGNPFGSGVREGFGECMNIYSPQSPGPYTVEDFAPYQAMMEDAVSKIIELRDGKPTAVRVADIYVADPAWWVEVGLDADCRTIWDASYQAIQNVAADTGAIFVSAYDVYNGPNHDEDPIEKGMLASDRIHPSPKGSEAMAAALHAVGYAELTDG